MKEIYFTKFNIDVVSNKMMKRISSLKIKKLRDNIDLKDSVLLVIDMQKYFTLKKSHAFVPSVVPVVERISKIQKIFKSNKRPVILTRHIDDLKNKNNVLLKWWKDNIKKTDPLSKIDERLLDRDFNIIEKTQYDAFYGTNLRDILVKNEIKKVFITGVISNLCCETTARSAFVNSFEVYFGIDTTASYCFDHHMASVLNISYGFGVPFILSDIQ